jgi:autotransporter-associated beta strand protein
MHSSVDVIGGRILGTALAAAILNDPANAAVKASARATALSYFQSATGSSDLFGLAHSAGLDFDPYASRERNKRLIEPWWTYVLPRRDRSDVPMVVPEGAEVLLETRQPYLSADQRREVLRTTALPSGHPLIDGPELWGRLNLFAAADGYGAFDQDVIVVMDASADGFSAADSWKNDIDGPGALIKQGSGTLILSGGNSFTGGTVITDGGLTAASARALGDGPVQVGATATLSIASELVGAGLVVAELVGAQPTRHEGVADELVAHEPTAQNPAGSGQVRTAGRQGGTVRVGGSLAVTGTLSVTLAGDGGHDANGPVLAVAGVARLDKGSELLITMSGDIRHPAVIPVLSALRVSGTFGRVTVSTPGYTAVARYDRDGVEVRLTPA